MVDIILYEYSSQLIKKNSPVSFTLPICTMHEKQPLVAPFLFYYYSLLPSILGLNSISLLRKGPLNVLKLPNS